jgi:hypothetical protein
MMLSSLFFISADNKKDGGDWPRKIKTDQGTIIIYQPQIESFKDDLLSSRAAISVQSTGMKEPVFGAMWFDSHVSTDRDTRTVTLLDMAVTAAKFPDIENDKVESLSRFLENEVPKWDLSFSLDDLLATVENLDQIDQINVSLDNTPPQIIFTTKPSVLITIDGDPVLKEIENSGYRYVENTPFFIVQEIGSKNYYIKGDDYWYTSPSTSGPWKNITNPPQRVSEIAEKAMGSDESQKSNKKTGTGPAPVLVVATVPTELLQSDGEPNYAPIQGTSLLYMTNTDSYILKDITSQETYVLISGRWFSAISLVKGPWKFVAPEAIPADFANIPADSNFTAIRSAIPGTVESKEALLDNSIPQTAAVDRAEATVDVKYDGNPKFETIPGTDMRYAVNTDKSVILVNGGYYCVDNAIWFVSPAPVGPWTVCVDIPTAVQQIPPECPVYNIKYVYVYSYTPTVVYVGYTPGYLYSYPYHGCVYYGTGYYYHPWYGSAFYPRPVTWGFGVSWNPFTGWGFSFGMNVGGPYGWFAYGWRPPYYGWWGPAGYRAGYRAGYVHGYYHGMAAGNRYPNHSYYGARNIASNNIYRNNITGVRYTGRDVYGSGRPGTYERNQRQTQRTTTSPSAKPIPTTKPSPAPATKPVPSAQPSPSTKPAPATKPPQNDRVKPTTQPAQKVKPAERVNQPNNIYTDKSGNVYKRDNDTWQKRENGQWKQANPAQDKTNRQPAPNTQVNDKLNKDYQARQRAVQQNKTYQSTRPAYQQPASGKPQGTSGKPAGTSAKPAGTNAKPSGTNSTRTTGGKK